MKKFLIITHAFPPFGGGGVQRMVKFSTLLKSYQWQATVVCPCEKNDSWLDYSQMELVKEIEQIRFGYRNLKNDSLIKRIIRRFYPIDVYFKWARQIIKLLLKKDLSEYKIILTSGPPHSVHLVGLVLSKKKNIKWVADFRDHFTLGPEYKAGKLKRLIDNCFERKILIKANAIIVNTATNKSEILERFRNADAKKIYAIYNGFDYNDLVKGKVTVNWNTNKKNYLYLGGLRGDRIDGVFYKILSKAFSLTPELRNAIRIHVIGDHSRKGNVINELLLTDIFEFHDPVAFNEVADYLIKADACVTWQRREAKYKGTIAGKVFDYIAMQKPIFSVGQDDGEIANMIMPNNIGISADPDNIEDAAEKFQKFHDKVMRSEFSYSSLNSSFFEKYNRVNQAKELSIIFNSIT